MKKSQINKVFPFIFLLLTLGTINLLTAEETKQSGKINVLLIDGQNNHDWVRCSPVMIETLKATGKFAIERATVTKSRVAEFSPDFTKYHVILSNYNGDSWTEKTKSNFVKYIKEGGNLVVVHAADNLSLIHI